jgi:hypothetical protein
MLDYKKPERKLSGFFCLQAETNEKLVRRAVNLYYASLRAKRGNPEYPAQLWIAASLRSSQ